MQILQINTEASMDTQADVLRIIQVTSQVSLALPMVIESEAIAQKIMGFKAFNAIGSNVNLRYIVNNNQ